MGLTWLLALVACAASVTSEHGGSSLRSALEALQRRQRGRVHGPLLPPPDYDALYEFVPPQGYPETDYGGDVEDLDDEPSRKYYVKVLDDDDEPSDAYKYKIIKKKNSVSRGESAFRERTHHSDNEKLRELFMERNDKNQIDDAADNDREYALFLGQLWSKYKHDKEHDNANSVPQGVVKLYKEKIVKKRYPDSWGPVAFKRKRSSDSQSNQPILFDYEGRKDGPVTQDPNYNTYDVSDDDKDDLREEYAIAFQPLDDESLPDIDDNQFTYDSVEKRFPVTKRSSDFYQINSHRKRFAQNQNKRETSKAFRSSSGTDPKIIQDLSKIFGESDIEIIKTPVKRSNTHEDHNHEHDHEVKPPMITTHNNTYEHNSTHVLEDDSHEHHGHNIHHPGVSAKEHEHSHDHSEMETHSHHNNEKPITVRKKSIDWSDYFGIDKRNKQSVSFVNDLSKDRLKKQYFDTFNEEVVYPLNSFRRHSFEKRNYVENKPNEDTNTHKDAHNPSRSNNRNAELSDETNKDLDGIDDRLKKMEGVMVDEALQYTNGPVQLDTKKEQEMKEQILSRLAAAYSLEKMRKALKEFKQSLQIQKAMAQSSVSTQPPLDEAKSKRVAVKKEKVDILSNDIPMSGKDHEDNNDFEDEQGAGHFLNGKIEEGFSEGYMGGSGRHRTPVMSTVGASGACPILAKIVQRCRGVDLLAGDRGQLFLPLCSLHQICYLCGEAPPTTCDLVFLSEADTTCEGDMGCQRAARSALMALRELHDNLADELDGECEANPCLPATLRLNLGWQRAFQR